MVEQSSGRAAVHAGREGRSFWVMGDRVTVLAHLEEPDLHVVDVEVPPGGGVPPHRHASAEIMRVLDGVVDFAVETEKGFSEVRAGAGDVFTVPADAPHGYRNPGPGPARLMCILDGRMVRFFQDAGSPEAPPPGPPDAGEIARIMGIAARHGIRLLGP